MIPGAVDLDCKQCAEHRNICYYHESDLGIPMGDIRSPARRRATSGAFLPEPRSPITTVRTTAASRTPMAPSADLQLPLGAISIDGRTAVKLRRRNPAPDGEDSFTLIYLLRQCRGCRLPKGRFQLGSGTVEGTFRAHRGADQHVWKEVAQRHTCLEQTAWTELRGGPVSQPCELT